MNIYSNDIFYFGNYSYKLYLFAKLALIIERTYRKYLAIKTHVRIEALNSISFHTIINDR